MRVSPKIIEELEPNQIFVFGSNGQGHHAGGAARIALEKFGAIWGQGDGLQGQSYAIDTMTKDLSEIYSNVDRFLEFAVDHPELEFLVTKIGTGIAGWNVDEMAAAFSEVFLDEEKYFNVLLPKEFIDSLIMDFFRPMEDEWRSAMTN